MFWELESLGIVNDESSVYDKFIDTIDYKNGRYENVILPDNYDFKFAQKIMDILLRFCVQKVALSADIEKAFLMVFMAYKNQLRFLWVEDDYTFPYSKGQDHVF